MSFVRNNADITPIEDTVFSVVKMAQADIALNGKDNVINATIGSLYNEESKLVAYESIFNHYNNIDNITKAKYAQSFTGNESYRVAVKKWVFGNANVNLNSSVIATIGGSGAVSMSMQNILDVNQTAIIPNVAWGSYKLMAAQYNLNVAQYNLLLDNHFDINDFKATCLKIMAKQHKVLAIINDPCHNPTGYSLTNKEWEEIINFANELSRDGEFIILNDIAYIDYAYNQDTCRLYMENFNNINDNVLIITAFSCSKTLTSYGLRCGAAIIMARDSSKVREVEIVFEKSARSTWSNIPNAAMDNFTWATSEGLIQFETEKCKYINLLKQRSTIFIKEALNCNLPIYKYNEGFFITIKLNNELRNKFHTALINEHIYTVKVNNGIRIAICSLTIDKTKGLAYKLKQILDSISA